MRCVRSLVFLLGLAAMASAGVSQAQDERPARRGVAGIAENGGFILGLDNAFGYLVEIEGNRSRHHFGFGPGLLAPRMSFHGVTRFGLTVGGVMNMLVLRENDRFEGAVMVLGPRIGFMLMSPRGIGVWPRVGITALVPITDFEEALYNVAIDVPLVISITTHAAVTLGPMLEQPLSRRPQFGMAGVTAGLMGAF